MNFDLKKRKILGQESNSERGLKEILNLGTVLIVSVKDPKPGIWYLQTSSNKKQSLRVTGKGDIDFTYGFSAKLIGDLTHSHQRPLTGKKNYFKSDSISKFLNSFFNFELKLCKLLKFFSSFKNFFVLTNK